MFQTKIRDRDSQLITASSVFVIFLSSGHFLLACAGLTVALCGIALVQQAPHKKAGKLLYLSGLCFVLIGILFNTGYQIGKDMAHRDARLSSYSAVVAPR